MENATRNEFEEIAHSGGIIQLTLRINEDGNKDISVGWRHSRPNAAVLIGYYVLYPGIIIEPYDFGGIGKPSKAPSVPSSIPMLLGSDSEGLFGHQCPICSGYWRGDATAFFCPYCGIEANPKDFLSNAQLKYASYYCKKWEETIEQIESGTIEINMDEIADATMGKVTRPDFYISDERQQTLLRCSSCDTLNDIIGRFGHCSKCFTRNDLTVFEKETISNARKRMRDGESPERQLRDIISGYEVLVKNYMQSLANHVPLTPERKSKVTRDNYSPEAAYGVFDEVFGINIQYGVSDNHWILLHKLYQRRHVHEHCGGIVDQKYLDQSGDKSVRIGQRLIEDMGEINQLASILQKSAKNIHIGFHKIFPPKAEPIMYFKAKQKRQ